MSLGNISGGGGAHRAPIRLVAAPNANWNSVGETASTQSAELPIQHLFFRGYTLCTSEEHHLKYPALSLSLAPQSNARPTCHQPAGLIAALLSVLLLSSLSSSFSFLAPFSLYPRFFVVPPTAGDSYTLLAVSSSHCQAISNDWSWSWESVQIRTFPCLF